MALGIRSVGRESADEPTFSGAFKKIAEQLPEYEQDALGDRLLKLIESDERDWDSLFESSADQLEKLADHALAEHSAGRTEVL